MSAAAKKPTAELVATLDSEDILNNPLAPKAVYVRPTCSDCPEADTCPMWSKYRNSCVCKERRGL